MKLRIPFVLILLAAMAAPARAADGPSVRFSRDILPILAANCFQCHGPDEKARKAKLRLDTQAGVLAVVVPGKRAESELVRRIHAPTDDGGMPPKQANRQLTAPQKETLKRWIDEGAAWSKHWAYELPTRPDLPPAADPAWARNGI